MTTTPDLVGWIATLLMVCGSIKIAHKSVLGLWLMLVGNVLFVLVGWLSALPSLIAVSILMGALDYYGIHCWRKDEERTS